MEDVSRLHCCLFAAALLCIGAVPAFGQGSVVCHGDCDVSGMVDQIDLEDGIAAIFAPAPAEICAAILAPGAETATVADLLAAEIQVGRACVVNEPPALPARAIYRSFEGFEIGLPLGAEDPDPPLGYAADDLPDGAVVDESGTLRWTPLAGQKGSYEIPVHVTDSGSPPLTADAVVPLRITPLDPCSLPACDPATGCTATLPPLSETCCDAGPPADELVPEPDAACPGGAVLLIGHNTRGGFGRLRNCNAVRLIGFSQQGITLRMHLATRCITTGQIVILRTRLESDGIIHSDREDTIILQATSSGYAQRLNSSPPVLNTSMALEGREANLSVSIEDPFTGVIVSETLRVVFRHGDVPDLPDAF